MEVHKGRYMKTLQNRNGKIKNDAWMKSLDKLSIGDTLIIEKTEWTGWGYAWGDKYASVIRSCVANYAEKMKYVVRTNVSECRNKLCVYKAA